MNPCLPLRVLGDRVLVAPDVDDRAPTETASGLVLAASMAAAVSGSDPIQAWSRGTVIAVGTPRHPLREEAQDLAGRLTKLAGQATSSTNGGLIADAAALMDQLVAREPSVSVGDEVVFPHDAGQELAVDQETYLVLKEDELLAVIGRTDDGA